MSLHVIIYIYIYIYIVFWFVIGFALFILLILLKAITKDRTDSKKRSSINRAFGYLNPIRPSTQTNLTNNNESKLEDNELNDSSPDPHVINEIFLGYIG